MPRRYRRRSRCAASLSRCGCRRPSRGWSGRMCQRNSVSGVTSHPARLGRGSAAAIASSRLRSVSVSSGRSTCRRSTVSWWRNTMISRSLERPERTVSRASDARNRYKIRYTRTQHRPASRQVNDHGRVSGTHRVLQRRRLSSSTCMRVTSSVPRSTSPRTPRRCATRVGRSECSARAWSFGSVG